MKARAMEPEILRAHVHVVHVQQQPAARDADDRDEKFPFVQTRMFEGHVGGHILEKQAGAQRVLGFADLARQHFDGFVGVRQRQQIIEEFAARMTPAGVLGDERRFEALDGAFHTGEVFAIDAVGRPQSQADAVQAQRVVRTGALERAYRGSALVEIVFGVRFDPADGRTLGDERLMMNGPKADPGACRNRPRRHTSCVEAWHRLLHRFLFRDLAAELLALAFRNVLPVIRRLVDLGLTGAGMRSRGAIVLAGFGDTRALFLGRVFGGSGDGAERKQAANG